MCRGSEKEGGEKKKKEETEVEGHSLMTSKKVSMCGTWTIFTVN